MAQSFDKMLDGAAAAEQHAAEIATSRVGGFGGSDAKLFLNIARKGLNRLSKGDNERIAIAMGLMEHKAGADNMYTSAGHKFEDVVDDSLMSFMEGFDRETVMQRDLAKNFKTFAHADFTRKDATIVYECKFFAKKSTDETEAEVMPQLQWYYMLGAKAVILVHGKGEVEQGFRVDEIVTRDIARNDEIIREIEGAINTLDKAISEGWQPMLKAADVPDDLALTWDSYFEAVKKIEELKEEMKPFEEIAEYYKSEILEAMKKDDFQSMSRTKNGVTHTATITTVAGARKFDDKKFLSAHPEYNLAEFYKQGKDTVRFTIK